MFFSVVLVVVVALNVVSVSTQTVSVYRSINQNIRETQETSGTNIFERKQLPQINYEHFNSKMDEK